jgi:hypothetical protein
MRLLFAGVIPVSVSLSIFPQKHLKQATQGDGTDENCQSDQIPAMLAQWHDAETIHQSDECHQQEERAADITVYAPTPERICYARHPHCG